MKLWKKATGLIKDRNSLLAASISRRTSYRNPDLESIVIKATSHDDSLIDYANFHRVYKWVRTSPMYVKPLLHAITSRMEKTKSWVVAIKGLMLMHGVFCCKIPAVRRIGRLPFDLSTFSDAHSSPCKTWPYDAFVRAYFTYLDQRSALLQDAATCQQVVTFKKNQLRRSISWTTPLDEEIEKVRKWEVLMELLLEIRPNVGNAQVYLVFEAMICVLTEVFDVYGRICKGVGKIVSRVYAKSEKEEAEMAVEVVRKAVALGKELEMYLEFCKEIGALGRSECPKVTHVPEEDVKNLERIIHDVVKENREEISSSDLPMVVVNDHDHDDEEGIRSRRKKKVFKTIITDKWEVFPDDDMMSWVSTGYNDVSAAASDYNNPFATSSSLMPYVAPHLPAAHHDTDKPVLPDLISF